MKKLIINLAPTGMIPTKEMTPHVPLTPEEIIADVQKCGEIGLSMVHLHARDSDGLPTYKKDIFAKIISGIRTNNENMVIIVSTSGRTYQEFDQRAEVLDLEGYVQPDMASLTLGSVNFNKTASINPPDTIIKLAEKMRKKGIKPELEIFDLGMMNYAHYLIRKELIEPPYYFNIILGNIAAAQAKLVHLGLIVSELPEKSYWSVGGVGDRQGAMNAIGVVEGDGVRTGIEDNIWYDENRTTLATNYTLVERVTAFTTALGRQIATPSDVRMMLGLKAEQLSANKGT
jgi:3-keto-5-aminohexanoate cleavage enzyme